MNRVIPWHSSVGWGSRIAVTFSLGHGHCSDLALLSLNGLLLCSHSSPWEAESVTVLVVQSVIQRLSQVKIRDVIHEGNRWWCFYWYTDLTCWNVWNWPLPFKDIWAEVYPQSQAFVCWVSSELGHLQFNFHQHIHKSLPANTSLDGLNFKHAYCSGVRHSNFWEQSY